MPSAWISTRPTKDGGRRFRVLFRVGGRESTPRYGGSFGTKRGARQAPREAAALRG